jgi:hypothetical protein
MKTLDPIQYVLQVSFLADEDMLRACQERIKSYSKRAQEVLDVFTFENGVIRGSDSFANVELASEHLALPGQVLHDLELNPEFFRGNYEDMGLVLRTDVDPVHNYNAKNLYEQLKHRGITASDKNPVMISLKGLSLKEDNESIYGLVHLLTDEAQIIQAPELSYKNNGRKFSKCDERGIPIFDKKGKRAFYSRQGGLGRLFLDRCLVLFSSWYGSLGNSGASGRVAVAKIFSSENSNQYLEKLKQEYEMKRTELDKEYQKAVALMKG